MFNYIFLSLHYSRLLSRDSKSFVFSSESIFDVVKITKNFGKKYALSEKTAKKSRIIWKLAK